MDDLKLHTVPDPILKKICRRIERDEYTKYGAIGRQMLNFMEDQHGVGLAAPQVGLDVQMFVASPTGKAADGKVYINPTIIMQIGCPVEAREGCLSIPGILLPIQRVPEIMITAMSDTGEKFTDRPQDLLARICQHETDHLYGILITDRFEKQKPTW